MADIPSAGNKENKVAKNIGDTALCKKTVVCRDEKMETIIGQIVRGKIDRPKGSRHPRYSDMIYPINYGYVEGVISEESTSEESFSNDLLEYPQYTRPEVFNGVKIPDVLISGHHENIRKWREEKSLEITKKKRPDLLH